MSSPLNKASLVSYNTLKPLKLSPDNLLALNNVKPLSDPRQVDSLPFCDVRRMAAWHAKERLNQLLKKQRKGFRSGQMKMGSSVSASLLPSVSCHQAGAVERSWAYFMKDKDQFGAQMLMCLFEADLQQLSCFPELAAVYKEGGFARLRRHPKLYYYGRNLVLQVMILVVNRRNNAAFRQLVERDFAWLYRKGFTQNDVKNAWDRLHAYLKMALGKQWKMEMSLGWQTLVSKVIELGLAGWGKEGEDDLSVIKPGQPHFNRKTITFQNTPVLSGA